VVPLTAVADRTLAETTRTQNHEDKILLVLTLIIGAIVGLVVVAFILLTENLGSRMYPAGVAAWRRVLIPVAGALGTGFLLFRYFPNARGSGIPQTKTALFVRDGFITFRTVLGKFGLCSVSLASGIALGREGPAVHVGAGIASVLARKLGLSTSGVKSLVPVGAAAALAAAFNTPISAVLFSLEEVMGDMHAPVLGSVVLGSATSWIVLHLVLGDEPLFHVPAYQLVHPVEFVFYAVLGVAGGFASVAFVKLLLWQRKYFLRMPSSTQWFLPGVGGLTVGLLGWFYPQVLGVGYSYVGQALNGQMLVGTMALLVLLKLIATATCYASGNAGGIFGPSLFIGAMAGGAVGGVAHMIAPDYTGGMGAYALVGMGTAFAGIVRVPLTSVIMIFEITRDYSIIVPLMISNLISYFISSRLQAEPIYEALQHQDGIHLPSGARAREALLMVGHAFRPEAQVLRADMTVAQAAAAVDMDAGGWPVVDESGLRGMLTEEQLRHEVAAGRGEQWLGNLVAPPDEELTAAIFPHVHADHPLDVAVGRLAQTGWKVLPVVSRHNVRELKGTISLDDILAAYRAGAPKVEAPAAAAAPKRRSQLPVLAGVLTVLVGLAIVATFLNYYYRAERSGRAQRYFQSGNELAARERYPEAIEQFRRALSIAHTPAYRLALAQALAKAGALNEAALYFREVLKDNATSAPANLGLARIDVAQGRIDGAVAHFQRAIYGSWPGKAAENRVQARLEMVAALQKAGRAVQAQGELLLLAAQVPDDPALAKEVGRMLRDSGLNAQAATLYHGILQKNSNDVGAWDGLGEAELAMNHYPSARTAFRDALRADPADAQARTRLDLCEQVLALDPGIRGLSARERRERSTKLLAAVAARCSVNVKPPRGAAEAMSTAEQIWSECNAKSPPDDAVYRIMSKLAH
jgi:CIC family chloride channel protein